MTHTNYPHQRRPFGGGSFPWLMAAVLTLAGVLNAAAPVPPVGSIVTLPDTPGLYLVCPAESDAVAIGAVLRGEADLTAPANAELVRTVQSVLEKRRCFPLPHGTRGQITATRPLVALAEIQVVFGNWFGWHFWLWSGHLAPSVPLNAFERKLRAAQTPVTVLGCSAGKTPACAKEADFEKFALLLLNPKLIAGDVLDLYPGCAVFENGTFVRRGTRQQRDGLASIAPLDGPRAGLTLYTMPEFIFEFGPGTHNNAEQPVWRE